MLADALKRVAEERQSLSRAEARAVMDEVLAGRVADDQIAALLVALAEKGETVEEIVGFAQSIRAAAPPWPGASTAPPDAGAGADLGDEIASAVEPSHSPSHLLDTCGTGGDAAVTFNISTATALVAAGAGARVAKHGNRSVSSKCGSADVMEKLGVKLDLPLPRLAACLEQVGIVFLFAPAMHSAMKRVQAARQRLRRRTVFNLLGPLTNPAGASAQIIGVYAEDLVLKLAEALHQLGVRRAMVVHGLDGLDEISLSAPTKIAELREGEVLVYEITPEGFGLHRVKPGDLAGGDAAVNAAIVREVLGGKMSPRRDVVRLNAAAALVVAGLAENIAEGLPLAAQAIDSGAARAKLKALVAFTSAN
jgi:anthranilate phosphoribosyltransferase